jgi:hypothetical protein
LLVIRGLANGQFTCLNDGSCSLVNGTGVCKCILGYTGDTCNSYLGCLAGAQLSCLNGGLCNSNNGSCQCPPGYTGSTCSIQINFCNSAPCLNSQLVHIF